MNQHRAYWKPILLAVALCSSLGNGATLPSAQQDCPPITQKQIAALVRHVDGISEHENERGDLQLRSLPDQFWLFLIIELKSQSLLDPRWPALAREYENERVELKWQRAAAGKRLVEAFARAQECGRNALASAGSAGTGLAAEGEQAAPQPLNSAGGSHLSSRHATEPAQAATSAPWPLSAGQQEPAAQEQTGPSHASDSHPRPDSAPLLGRRPSLAGRPFTKEHLMALVRYAKVVGEGEMVDLVRNRGLTFIPTGADRTELRRAGAGKALLEAVVTAEQRPAEANPLAGLLRAARGPVTPVTDRPRISLPRQDEARQRALIEQARTKALEYADRLPGFTCLLTSTRQVDIFGRGEWQTKDVIVARLAYDRQRETSRVITVNDDITARVSNHLPYLIDEKRDESSVFV